MVQSSLVLQLSQAQGQLAHGRSEVAFVTLDEGGAERAGTDWRGPTGKPSEGAESDDAGGTI